MRGLLCVATMFLVPCAALAKEQPKFTLNGDEAPSSKPWTEPASFVGTKTAGEKASVALDGAARVDWRIGDPESSTRTAFLKGLAHRNTSKGSQVKSYAAKVGLHFEPDTAPENSRDPGVNRDAWYLFNDLSVGYAYKTNYDDEKDGCETVPKPVKCVRSHEGSARVEWTVQPFWRGFESVESYKGGKPTNESPIFAYSFGPTFSLFSDQVLHAKLDGAGAEPKGNATGATAGLAIAVSPKLTDYRLTLRASVKQTEAFERASRRFDTFPKSSRLKTLSLDWALGPRSFDEATGWTPSLGISYTKGDDPLSGKLEQEETIYGLKLSYKGS